MKEHTKEAKSRENSVNRKEERSEMEEMSNVG